MGIAFRELQQLQQPQQGGWWKVRGGEGEEVRKVNGQCLMVNEKKIAEK